MDRLLRLTAHRHRRRAHTKSTPARRTARAVRRAPAGAAPPHQGRARSKRQVLARRERVREVRVLLHQRLFVHPPGVGGRLGFAFGHEPPHGVQALVVIPRRAPRPDEQFRGHVQRQEQRFGRREAKRVGGDVGSLTDKASKQARIQMGLDARFRVAVRRKALKQGAGAKPLRLAGQSDECRSIQRSALRLPALPARRLGAPQRCPHAALRADQPWHASIQAAWEGPERCHHHQQRHQRRSKAQRAEAS